MCIPRLKRNCLDREALTYKWHLIQGSQCPTSYAIGDSQHRDHWLVVHSADRNSECLIVELLATLSIVGLVPDSRATICLHDSVARKGYSPGERIPFYTILPSDRRSVTQPETPYICRRLKLARKDPAIGRIGSGSPAVEHKSLKGPASAYVLTWASLRSHFKCINTP